MEEIILALIKDAPTPWNVLICTLLGWGVMFLRDLARSVATATKSIEALNQTMLLLVHRTDGHEEKLEDHEARLRAVEKVA